MTTTYPSLETPYATDPSCPPLWDALRDVTDPEIPISVVDMGLIVDLQAYGGSLMSNSRSPLWVVLQQSSLWTIFAHVCCKSQASSRCISRSSGVPSGPKSGSARKGSKLCAPGGYQHEPAYTYHTKPARGRTERHVWQVYARRKYDEPLHEIGNVMADDVELAKVYARSIYDEFSWIEMVIIPRETIVTVIAS